MNRLDYRNLLFGAKKSGEVKMACTWSLKYTIRIIFVCLTLSLMVGAGDFARAQGNEGEMLQQVEVEPPADNQRQITSRTGANEGFGYDQPIPGGLPFSDYSLSPSEIVSATRRTTNIATIHSAASVVENKGIQAQGNSGLSNMLEGQTGVWTSSFGGNPFNSQIVMRGFSNGAPNRVALLVDGRSLNIPRTEANTNFFFPEMIERVEILRGDGNVQFGNKAIGGVVNVILKKPRQNPGIYFGAEGGSWHMDREWAAVNLVRGPIAAGIFMGRYFQEGWRIYEGNGIDAEPVARPGPWSLYSFTGSLNWKITPKVTFDIMLTKSDQRVPFSDWVPRLQWETRDLRNFQRTSAYDNGPDESWDTVCIGKILYEGGRLGNFEIIGSWRSYDRRTNSLALGLPSDNRWQDYGLSFKYDRTDEYSFFRNDITLGSDLYDGRFRREARYPVLALNFPPFNTIQLLHAGFQGGYRESISYYVINQTRLWDRLILGLGYRIESYDLKNLYANDNNRVVTNAQESLQREKSASQWSVGFVYDRELGSNVYYKHARLYRFPNFDDIINFGIGFPPSFNPPFFPLDPEEGTLDEVGLRHWFTRNIYASATYYELDMDNEILFGTDLNGNFRNNNVRGVSHTGLELEALVRFTPRWTLQGNYTRQAIIVRSNFRPDFPGQTTEDKWLWQNPADLANLTLSYENKDWGFSALIAGHYVGSQYRTNDPFNESEPLEPAKWGDIAFSQSFFDGLATLYFGVKNFTDRQYALLGTRSSPSPFFPPSVPAAWYPNAGRTYYMGMKSEMDFNRMRMPTTDDLNRMNRRLYGAVRNGASTFTGMGNRLWGFVQ